MGLLGGLSFRGPDALQTVSGLLPSVGLSLSSDCLGPTWMFSHLYCSILFLQGQELLSLENELKISQQVF